MRHDYDLPGDWASMSQEEKSRWMTQERARRQSKRQTSAEGSRRDHAKERFDRRLSASGYKSLRENR